MRIAIVGAGALGLYYGAKLQRAGQDVHFVLRRDYEAISTSGLKVFSVDGDFLLPHVQAYRHAGEIGPVDLVLVGLKTFANSHYHDMIAPLLGEGTQILTLQNGLGNEELLAELFGAGRILGGVAFLCSNRGEPGTVHHLGAGRIIVGEFQPRNRERIERLCKIFVESGVPCTLTDDLGKTRWEKLVWNIPFNGLCALLQQPVNELLGRKACRTLTRDLMVEVIRAANSQGLGEEIKESFADKMLEFTDNMGVYKPSMQIDREEGRQLEIDAIFRVPLSRGATQGVPMPRVEMLAALLEQATAPSI